MTVTRMLTVWCPDWPVVAWGVPLDEPSVVVTANRVIATSPAARLEGIKVGQRRRDAQGRCPEVAVLDRDVDREARVFEPLVAALEAFTPRLEISGPGLVSFPTLGPSRFFGGDQEIAHLALDAVGTVLGERGEVRVGVADGSFAAYLAARSLLTRSSVAQPDSDQSEPNLIAKGGSAEFLAPLSIQTLLTQTLLTQTLLTQTQSTQVSERQDLVDVLGRLGLHTLGAFASLSAADVVGRFGREGQLAHRLASGTDEHTPDLKKPLEDLSVTWLFEPAAERIDRCAFAAKALADELHETLLANGLACVRVAIEAETENGECHLRLWRHEGALSAAALAERARWQLDGWLQMVASANAVKGNGAKKGDGPSAGVTRLSLIPDEVIAATGRQLGFWGGRAERADEVTRAVARLQGLLGPEAIMVPERRGGRGVAEQISLIPAAAVDLGEMRVATELGWVQEPWSGQLPLPAPTKVWTDPVMVEVLDAIEQPIGVSGRGELSSTPEIVCLDLVPHARRRVRSRVVGWAGPWPADERWWDAGSHRRRARLQLELDDGSAHVVMIEHGSWWLEATY